MLTFHLAWFFPEHLYPLSPCFEKIRYRLVARITSTSDHGAHFKTLVKTTDDLIFEIDGMARHTHTGIQQISKWKGFGYGRCLNQKGGKKRDISSITGIQPRTVAVFYVLEIGGYAQETFFYHQQSLLQWADEEGPINLGNEGGRVKFVMVPNCINTWISTPAEEINWNTQHPEREFKLNVLQIPYLLTNLMIGWYEWQAITKEKQIYHM